VPGYTEKILGLLLKHSEYPNAAQLAVLFIEATKPPLDNSEKMMLYMDGLIQTDLDAAFKYQVSPLLMSVLMVAYCTRSRSKSIIHESD
jgi:hypothetical protein